MREYLLERQKAGQPGFYIMRTVQAKRMNDAAEQARPDLAPGDTLRVTLLSVALTCTPDGDGWKVAHATV